MELGGRQHGEPPLEPRGKPVARPWQEQASAFTARQRCRQRRLEQQRVPRARECMSPALIRACARTRKQGPSATLQKKNAPSSPLSLRSRFAVFSSLSSISHRNTHTKHGDFHPDTLFRLFPILTSPIEHPRRDGGARMTEDAFVFQTQRPSAPRFDVFRRFGALQGALR